MGPARESKFRQDVSQDMEQGSLLIVQGDAA
jgi:hypothetical protein